MTRNVRFSMALLITLAFFLFLFSCTYDKSAGSDDDLVDDDLADDDAADDDLVDDDAVDDDLVDDDLVDDDTVAPEGTRYPLVLMHGFFGWGDAGPNEYYYGVSDDLRELGYEVFVPRASAINSMEVRAQQFAVQIEERYPGQRVNVIGHSQAALDARYIITTMGWGDRIASVVSVSGPHYGTALVDIVVGLMPGFAEEIIDWLMNLFGMDWDGIAQLTHDYVENVFNPANPDDPDVAYYSLSADAEDNCFFLLELSHFLIGLFDGPNDGIVPEYSAHWGEHLGVLPIDHWGMIGQPFGLTDYDYQGLYRDIAAFLAEQGF